MAKPKLQILSALRGDLRHIGFHRNDSPIFHTIIAAAPGAAFQVDAHFADCEICRAHRVTQDDFHEFMTRPN